jgi:pyochelin synthetase
VSGRGDSPERARLDGAELRAWLETTLPSYMVPAVVHIVAALPLTANGKIDRQAIPSLASPSQTDRLIVQPSDDLERQLVDIWEDILDVRPIGVTVRFFDVGGDSFLAVRLMLRVQNAIGTTLPVSTLFEANDIAGLARVIRAQQPPSSSRLVRLASGAMPPFFCVHPIGGNVMCYVDLTRCLGDVRACYAMQARGMYGEATPFTDITTMAAHYLDEIRTVQAHGPYLLGGWSMGGTVAFEIAQQLRAQGEATGMLVLIDAETSAVADSVAHSERGLPALGQIPPDVNGDQLRYLLDVVTNNDRALKAYRERSYFGPVTLFRADEQPDGCPNDLGWGAVVAGGPDVHVVPGNHYTMLQQPNVATLASRLRFCLEGCLRK